MASPFQYGTIASGRGFVNRKQEKEQVKSNLLAGINTILISPRRWGKTSLVNESISEICQVASDRRVCQLDLFAVSSEEEFYEELLRAAVQSISSRPEHWMEIVHSHLGALTANFAIRNNPSNQLSISIPSYDVEKHSCEILDLVERIAIDRQLRIIACIDEFQNIAYFKNYESFEERLAAAWKQQHHVSYCLYGSKRHIMTSIFGDPSKPFHHFGEVVTLEKIPIPEWVDFIMDGFKSTGKRISAEMAERIVSLMDGHSWYVQQLSHFVWMNTILEVDLLGIERSISQIVSTNSPYFIAEYESYSKTQANMLKAMMLGEHQLTSKRVMESYELGTNRNITRNKQMLEHTDIVEYTDDGYKFLDPVFAIWFKERVLRRG